jgi:hypothetical protein
MRRSAPCSPSTEPTSRTRWPNGSSICSPDSDLAPDALAQRLEDLWHRPYPRALMIAETLLAEPLRLAAQHSGADLDSFRETLAEQRRPADAMRPNPPRQ